MRVQNRSCQQQQETKRTNCDNQFAQQKQHMASSNKEKEGNLDSQRPANTLDTTRRNQCSKEAIHPSMNRQDGESSKSGLHNSTLENVQGNISLKTFTYNNDGTMKEIDRSNRIYNESGRHHEEHYQFNFPKTSSNFHRPVHKGLNKITDQPSRNANNFHKKDQVLDPAPYTLIQTYADRLRYNQAKSGVSIKLTQPKITTKQGLPAVLHLKVEVIMDLSSTCKFTLISIFVYNMRTAELIRKSFILLTQ